MINISMSYCRVVPTHSHYAWLDLLQIMFKPFVLSESALQMSQTALAVIVAVVASFVGSRQRALNTEPPPAEEPAPEPVWLEPEEILCQCPAVDCGSCPACSLLGHVLPWQALVVAVGIFIVGILVGVCCCERLFGFPQPTARHGRSIVRRSTTGHAIAG